MNVISHRSTVDILISASSLIIYFCSCEIQPCPKDLLESVIPCSTPGSSLGCVTFSKHKCYSCYFSLSCRWKILGKLHNAGCVGPWEFMEENLSYRFLHQHPNHNFLPVNRITIYEKAPCPPYAWSIVLFCFFFLFLLVFSSMEHVLLFCLSPWWRQLIDTKSDSGSYKNY